MWIYSKFLSGKGYDFTKIDKLGVPPPLFYCSLPINPTMIYIMQNTYEKSSDSTLWDRAVFGFIGDFRLGDSDF